MLRTELPFSTFYTSFKGICDNIFTFSPLCQSFPFWWSPSIPYLHTTLSQLPTGSEEKTCSSLFHEWDSPQYPSAPEKEVWSLSQKYSAVQPVSQMCIIMQCQGKRLLCQVQPLSSQQEMDHHHHHCCLFRCSKGFSLDLLTIIQLHNQGCKALHSFSVADIGSRKLLAWHVEGR